MTINEYWNLVGREPFLAITWELDFSKHFKQIPDKTNDVIFLKSPKTMFLGHFGPFLVIFAKKIRLSHTTISGPLTPCWLSDKTNEPTLKKLTDRRKDERKNGRTDRPYLIGPFRPRPGVQLENIRKIAKLIRKTIKWYTSPSEMNFWHYPSINYAKKNINFLVLSSFTWFFYCLTNILSRIADKTFWQLMCLFLTL